MIQTVVYFVDSAIFGGSEQALLHLLAGLDRRRWHPILFHHSAPGLEPLMEGARNLGVETRVVPRLAGAQTLTGLPRFIKQLREERPALFHAHLSWLLSCKYGLLAARLARVPAVIATAHNFMYPPWGRTVYLQQQIVTRFVDQYIAVSQAVNLQLQQIFNVPAQKIRVIHNCIPFTRFDCPPNPALRAELSQGRAHTIVVTVARLDWQKGHSYLFEAIRQIRDAIFVLAGSGPEREALATQASELGIQERVIFLGARNDIPELLASCDLFVLPSIYEGLPLSVLEAMAAGKAVVATAVGGTPEAVLDGKTGLLVQPGDPVALAKAIQEILSDPLLSREMGAAGKARVQQEFSSATMVQHITHFYEELLEKPG
jgi:glycosyltransferase involved in cell wall biosynthesis